MPTTSNFGWNTPADTDLVKDGAAAIRTLGNNIDASLLDLKGGTTGQNLRKNSNTDLDFTWAGDATNTVIDAEGDLLVGDSSDTLQRLPIGTTGQVLTVDTAVDGKIKWASAATGGMTLISTTSLSGASITLTAIPGTYKDLQIIIRDYTFAASTGGFVYVQLNADTTSNAHREIVMTGNTTTAQTLAYQGIDFRNRNIEVGFNPQENSAVFTIYDYANTAAHKIADFSYFYYGNDGNDHIEKGSGGYMSTSAITSIKIGGSAGTFDAGSVLLYGVS